MPELIRPEAIFVNRPAAFRIRLVPPDPEGTYRFRFAPVTGREDDHGFVEEEVTRTMRLGRWDAELEVNFLFTGTRELQYRFDSPLVGSGGAQDNGERVGASVSGGPSGGETAGTTAGAAEAEGSKPRSRSRAKNSSAGTSDDGGTVVTGIDTWSTFATIEVLAAQTPPAPDSTVALVAAPAPSSPDETLWFFIRRITDRLRFDEFHEIVQPLLTGSNGPEWYGTDVYRRLSRAAQRFVELAADPTTAVADRQNPAFAELSAGTVAAGLRQSYVSDEDGDLAQPFLGFDGARAPANGFGRPFEPKRGEGTATRHNGHFGRATSFPLPNVPFVELIWNYWIEEGMLVQTLNHVLARFQNRRLGNGRDALARFDLNPLLPLRNLLWGFAELEQDRLTVRRRAAEYQYQYGLTLLGRAVPPASSVVDSRTQFLRSFHGLLNAAHGFFKERDDKTVDADAFPLLSSLREVHLVLSYGAHNQFADLPLTARAQFLAMQWVISQPEMREFLGGPTMVPYEEPWMDRVDAMKTLQGWSPVSVTHFFDLATCGEQVVLSVRHGRWNESTRTRDDAANWALTWRNEIQRYLHAYRTVTGVDLTTTLDATMPSTLLARRLERERGARRA